MLTAVIKKGGDPVYGLVQNNGVYLMRDVQTERKVTKDGQKLRVATASLAKVLLEGGENVARVKKVHDRAVNDMFKKFTSYTSQGDRSVIFYTILVPFLKSGKMSANFKSSGLYLMSFEKG